MLRASDQQEPIANPPRKNKALEAVLELGRNWALATALAAFSATLFATEAIHGVALYKRWIAIAGIFAATVWIILAIERAAQVAEIATTTKRQRLVKLAFNLFLLAFGSGIVMSISSMADNRRLVQICSDYASRPTSGVYHDPKCQDLYRQRAEFTERLENIQVPSDRK